MKKHLKKLIAGSLAAALCLLSGCTSAPDTRDDPLSGYSANALPFGTRVPGAIETTSVPTQTPLPDSTDIVSLPQDWQNESAPENDNSTNVPTQIPTQVPTIVPTATYVRPSYVYSKLEQGDEGDEVARLQARLIELGYLSGTADGSYGANTKAAVKRFQKAIGMSQTGVASESLQEKLFMNTAPAYQPEIPSVTVPVETNLYTVLVRGDKGEEVRKLQARLIELGYLSGTADGDFGANTENAVKRFQSVLGLSQTGVASAAVQAQLYASSAPYAPAPTQAPTRVPTPTPQPQATLSYQQLEPGDSGDAVRQMQTRLKELGYFSGSATGNYYRETTEAVKQFQKAIGMSETGIASSAMLIKLYSAEAPAYSDVAQNDPTDAPGGYTLLRRGSTGTEVVNLQKRLIALGYLSGSADGAFGVGTENAVKLFQYQVGFEQNGIASVGLQNLLFSAAAPTYVPVATSVPTTVPTSVPTQTPASRYQQLEPGDSGEAVKQLQTRLKELGFFAGQLGGNYLTKTTASVKLFQAAIGHAETGIATPEMQEILFSEDAPDYDSVESDYITLEKLDSGIQVLYLQQRLKELGYLSGSADGDYGNQTANAVKAFQQQAGLPATGIATPETQTLLFSSIAPYAPTQAPTQIPTQVPTQAPTQIPTQVPTQIPTQIPTQVPSQSAYTTLRSGMSGDAVRALQLRLKELGFFEGNTAGNYLDLTETAVRLFQAEAGYTVDGVATAELQEYLFSGNAPAFSGTRYIELRKGMTSPAVRNLQRALIANDYLSGTADGEFGSNTQTAVKKLQNTIGHEADGVADVELQSILFSGSIPTVPVSTPVPTQAPTQAPSSDSGYRTLTAYMSGDDVKAVQERLLELGYYDGLLLGNYKSITELSFKLFQAAIGQTPDGVATPEQQEILFSSSAPYYNATAFVDLKEGDEGVAVKTLQQRLIDLGYLSGSADGMYGSGTGSAVKKFQKEISYGTTDGVATAALQQQLFASDAPAYGSGKQNGTNPSLYTTLKPGSNNSQVADLQARLKELGFYNGIAGGNYKPVTELSVKLFQAAVGYTPDGIATPELQAILFSDSAPYYNGTVFIDLENGDVGIAVITLQRRLIDLGYLSGSADGEYGNGTQNAVKRFQQAIGYSTTDGVATAALQQLLFAADAPAYGDGSGTSNGSDNSETGSVGSYSDYRTLKNGNSGEDVKVIQRRLQELGYFNGEIGGNYLTKTETAFTLFQTALGVPADGIATPALQMRLLSASAPAYIEADAPEQFTVLSTGDDGSSVKLLQKRLIELGWLTGTADGDFGPGTEQAVAAFQYRVGLTPDGVAGIETQDLLYAPTAPQYVEYVALEAGAKGEKVLDIQLRLVELGYLEASSVNLDGIYGSGLKYALSRFQLAIGVDANYADGVATVELQQFLFSANANLYAITR